MLTASLVILTAFWLVTSWSAVGLWREQEVPERIWSLGPMGRARVRSLPFTAGAGALFLLAGWIYFFDPNTKGGIGQAFDVAAVVSFLLFVAALVTLGPLIHLVNRPRILVAPALRSLPGYLKDRSMKASK
jgi:hypothetical protein